VKWTQWSEYCPDLNFQDIDVEVIKWETVSEHQYSGFWWKDSKWM
jgi:hypothetical protein